MGSVGDSVNPGCSYPLYLRLGLGMVMWNSMGDCRVIDIPRPFRLVMNLLHPGLNRRVVPRMFLRSNDIPSIPNSPCVDFFLTTASIGVPGIPVNPGFLG